MSSRVFDFAGFGLLLALTGAAPAHADTLTQVVDLGLVSANTTIDWVYDQFDPTLGTLESVTIEFEGSFLNGFRFGSAGSPASFQIGFTDQATVLGLDGEVIYTSPALSNSYSRTAASSASPATPGAPGSPRRQTLLAPEYFSGSYTWDQTLDLEDFIGADTVSIPFLTSTSYVSQVDGAGWLMGGSKVQVSAELTYIYSPTPEPETYLMLLAGLGLTWLKFQRTGSKNNRLSA